MTPEDIVLAAVGSAEFVSASLSGLDALGDHPALQACAGPRALGPIHRITIRPVDLAAGAHLQFVAFDGRRTHTRNFSVPEGLDRCASVLAARTSNGRAAGIYVRTVAGDLQLTHSRKGASRLIRHSTGRSARPRTVDRSHDRARARRVPEDAPFLRVTGISDAAGRVTPTGRAKYTQVEHFLEILDHALAATSTHGARSSDTNSGDPAASPTDRRAIRRIVDMGCGAGVLTLAAFHDLALRRGLEVEMIGIDTNRELIENLTSTVATLGWEHVRFLTAAIPTTVDDFAQLTDTDGTIDLMCALHACDTATDDALAVAVRSGAHVILAAPCCQHDLQSQLRATAPSAAPDQRLDHQLFEPILRHGIMFERWGDLLTDALRAEILRAHGYRADVIEFVSTEHTGKNLMIRAIRNDHPDPEAMATAASAARALASAWGVTPALARRIGYGAAD